MLGPVPTLLVNGRFLLRPLTGVDRIALELSREIVQANIGSEGTALAVVVPVSARGRIQAILNQLSIKTTAKGFGVTTGQLWEQTALQIFSPRSMLLSFCNMGPVFRRKQFLFVADAQFVTQPQSYNWMFRFYFRLLLPIAARVSKHLATISEHSREQLESAGIFPRGKAHIVHCGSDHILSITPDGTAMGRFDLESETYFLMVGSLAPHKNMRFLISMISGRLPPGVKLVIAGGGNAKVFKDSEIVAGDDVVLLGRVTDEELVALYGNAYALVFPSLTEGFGLPPVEAMRCGCPVIASTGGAIPEISGDAAIYVDPMDGDGWVRAINDIWHDKKKREELKLAGYKQCQKYSWEKSARHLLDIIREN